MINKFIIVSIVILTGCAVSGNMGDTRTKELQLLDENTFLITETTDDRSYGYNKSNPIKVGGANDSSGPLNERRFLNALTGPNGETIIYERGGSCCAFKTPNGPFGNSGMLDRYEITWLGATDTLDIYINMYDKGDIKIPVGLTAREE